MRKGQFDMDESMIIGIVFAVIAFMIGLIVAKSMGSGLPMRLISGLVCAIAAFFMIKIIANN